MNFTMSTFIYILALVVSIQGTNEWYDEETTTEEYMWANEVGEDQRPSTEESEHTTYSPEFSTNTESDYTESTDSDSTENDRYTTESAFTESTDTYSTEDDPYTTESEYNESTASDSSEEPYTTEHEYNTKSWYSRESAYTTQIPYFVASSYTGAPSNARNANVPSTTTGASARKEVVLLPANLFKFRVHGVAIFILNHNYH